MGDMYISENIFGTDVRILEIKSTSTKPNPIHRYDIDIPK